MLNFVSDAAKILFKSPFKQKIGKIEILLISSRETTKSASLTKNPIEDGSLVSDHIVRENDQVVLTGKISEFSVQNSILSSALRLENPFKFNSAKLDDVYKELVRIFEAREPIDLILPREKFKNMVLTNLRFPESPGSAKVLIFDATFEKANIVFSETRLLTNSKVSLPRARQKTSFGNQVSAPATPAPKSTITLTEFFKGIF